MFGATSYQPTCEGRTSGNVDWWHWHGHWSSGGSSPSPVEFSLCAAGCPGPIAGWQGRMGCQGSSELDDEGSCNIGIGPQ